MGKSAGKCCLLDTIQLLHSWSYHICDDMNKIKPGMLHPPYTSMGPCKLKSHSAPKPTHLRRPQMLPVAQTGTVQSKEWLRKTQTETAVISAKEDPLDTDTICKDWKRQRHWQHQLEEEINRCQSNKSFNNLKTITTPEPSGHTTGRPDHHNPEAEENGLKYTFLKMIDTLKEEMKNFLKEMEEETIIKLEEINKSFKEPQEN